MSTGNKIVVTLAIASLMGFAPGCGDEGDDASATQGLGTTETTDATPAEETDDEGIPLVEYASDVQSIWDGNCLCHMQGPSGTMQAPMLTLNAEVSYEELVGMAAEQLPSMLRVAAGDAEASYLWHKLRGSHLDVGGSGSAMPQLGELDDDDLAVIEAWIAAGAEP